jgi:hypothetical protein
MEPRGTAHASGIRQSTMFTSTFLYAKSSLAIPACLFLADCDRGVSLVKSPPIIFTETPCQARRSCAITSFPFSANMTKRMRSLSHEATSTSSRPSSVLAKSSNSNSAAHETGDLPFLFFDLLLNRWKQAHDLQTRRAF